MQNILIEVGAIKEKDSRVLHRRLSHDETSSNGRFRDSKPKIQDEDDWD